MFCDECKKNPATVHLTRMFNGKKEEMHLCQECAAQKGALVLDINKFTIPNLLGSFLGSNYNLPEMQVTQVSTCPNCRISLADIRKSGKLGCAECYSTFDREIEPTLRSIHGNSKHIGKIPERGGEKVLLKREIDRLKAQLQKAVVDENYEKAAQIRDVIKEIERKME